MAYRAVRDGQGGHMFECGMCGIPKRGLRCYDTVRHDGAICVDCIQKLDITEEQKQVMMNDGWDWNFGTHDLPEGPPRFAENKQ